MKAEDRIGARIAAIRTLRNFTQQELARRAQVSYSLVTKVESGHAPATPAFISAAARALRVDVPRIIGQPYEETGQDPQGPLRAVMEPVRHALGSFYVPSEGVPPRPGDELERDVRDLSDLGRKADYLAMGKTLPGLLDDLAIAIHAAPDHEQPRLYALLAEAYSGASSISTLLGYLDLRDRVVDRTEWASQLGDDPLRPFRVRWQRSASLMSQAAYDPALALMDRTRRELGGDPVRMEMPVRSLYGSLFLRSAVLSARAARTEKSDLAREARARDARSSIEAAREVAEVMGQDRDDYGLAFGPSNVTQHAVSVEVELEEGTRAVEFGRKARLGATVPAVRRGHHQIDMARGYLLHGDHAGAFASLQRARRIAPQQTRHHPMVRETVFTIAMAGRGSEALTRFATWLGI